MRALWAAVVGLLAVGCGTAAKSSDAAARDQGRLFPDAPARAVIRAVRGTAEGRTLVVRWDGAASDTDVPFAAPVVPARYAAVAQADWSGECLSEGAEIRLARFEGNVLTVERRVGPPASDPEPLEADVAGWELCYARLYFERDQSTGTTVSGETHLAVATVLGRLAMHRSPLAVWLHGPADRLLQSYRATEPMIHAARAYDEPALVQSVGAVQGFLTQSGDENVLTKNVPFRYKNRSQRPVGGWGAFVIAIYRDQADGAHDALRPVFDYSTALSKP